MKKQKKQNLLTTIIILLVIILAMLVGSIVYEEVINMKKQPIQDTSLPEIEEEEDTTIENDEAFVEDKAEDEVEEKDDEQENVEEPENKQEYVGEEENNSQEQTTENKDEKAIQAVKKEWGEDTSVTFSIEQKKGNIYYVAVKSESASTVWYEVNIDTWEVSEY